MECNGCLVAPSMRHSHFRIPLSSHAAFTSAVNALCTDVVAALLLATLARRTERTVEERALSAARGRVRLGAHAPSSASYPSTPASPFMSVTRSSSGSGSGFAASRGSRHIYETDRPPQQAMTGVLGILDEALAALREVAAEATNCGAVAGGSSGVPGFVSGRRTLSGVPLRRLRDAARLIASSVRARTSAPGVGQGGSSAFTADTALADVQVGLARGQEHEDGSRGDAPSAAPTMSGRQYRMLTPCWAAEVDAWAAAMDIPAAGFEEEEEEELCRRGGEEIYREFGGAVITAPEGAAESQGFGRSIVFLLSGPREFVAAREANSATPELFLCDLDVDTTPSFRAASTLGVLDPNVLAHLLSFLPTATLFDAAAPCCSSFAAIARPIISGFHTMRHRALAQLQEGRRLAQVQEYLGALRCFEDGLYGFLFCDDVEHVVVSIANIGGCLDFVGSCAAAIAYHLIATQLAQLHGLVGRMALAMGNCAISFRHLGFAEDCSNVFFAFLHAVLGLSDAEVGKLEPLLVRTLSQMVVQCFEKSPLWSKLRATDATNANEPHSPDTRSLRSVRLLAEFVDVAVLRHGIELSGFDEVGGADIRHDYATIMAHVLQFKTMTGGAL